MIKSELFFLVENERGMDGGRVKFNNELGWMMEGVIGGGQNQNPEVQFIMTLCIIFEGETDGWRDGGEGQRIRIKES